MVTRMDSDIGRLFGKLKDLMQTKGYELRNSSIDLTKPNNASDPNYVRQLLKSRIEWAGTTLVLIGPETHKREWVDWEIETSNKCGNRIVGIFIHGATDSNIPDALEKFGDSLVGWNSSRIADAIDGAADTWETASGEIREPRHTQPRIDC